MEMFSCCGNRSFNKFLFFGGILCILSGVGEIYYGLQAFLISTVGFGAFYVGFLSFVFGINCFIVPSNCMHSFGLIVGTITVIVSAFGAGFDYYGYVLSSEMNTCASSELYIYGDFDYSNQARGCALTNPGYDCACVKAADDACYEWDLRKQNLDCNLILEDLPHALLFSWRLCCGCLICCLYCWIIYISSLCCKNCCRAICPTGCCVLSSDIEDAASSEPLLYGYQDSPPPPVTVIAAPLYDSYGSHIQSSHAVSTIPDSPPSYFNT